MSIATSKFDSVVALLAIPPMAVALFGLLLALRVPPVVNWFWPVPSTNVAEAAALGDAARVRALAARGAPLDMAWPVDPRFLDDDAPATMSALEAAVRRRSDSLVAVLLELGVRPKPAEARRLYCLAVDRDIADVADLLQRAFSVLPTGCGPAQPPQ